MIKGEGDCHVALRAPRNDRQKETGAGMLPAPVIIFDGLAEAGA